MSVQSMPNPFPNSTLRYICSRLSIKVLCLVVWKGLGGRRPLQGTWYIHIPRFFPSVNRSIRDGNSGCTTTTSGNLLHWWRCWCPKCFFGLVANLTVGPLVATLAIAANAIEPAFHFIAANKQAVAIAAFCAIVARIALLTTIYRISFKLILWDWQPTGTELSALQEYDLRTAGRETVYPLL